MARSKSSIASLSISVIHLVNGAQLVNAICVSPAPITVIPPLPKM